VKLAVYIMTLADLTKLLKGAIIGFIVGFFTRRPLNKLAERRALLKSMGDYVRIRATFGLRSE
jgi:multisubunit Na+/H+ antiporter MnhE subunit